MTPEEKKAFKTSIAKAKEDVKESINNINITFELEDLKGLVHHSFRSIELLLAIANKSLDD